MKSKEQIRQRIDEYKTMQEQVAGGEIGGAEERYAIRVLELEWVLDDDA